jgi:adenine-specific DNA-methyltransferase
MLARDLLTPEGVILISINDENRARLELLMDEVFPGRRLGSLVWRTKDTGNDLGQRFSHVHEHVLIYANPGFRFNGRATDRAKFRNPDGDPRGDWAPRPMSTNKSLDERRNTYYPIQDPATGYWYPCDPDSVWRFASETEMRKRLGNSAVDLKLGQLRSETIETMLEKKLIYFPPCKAGEVMCFESKETLLDAIRRGKGPSLPKKKTPLLREDLPDLDFWVKKPIAIGRPSRKDFWNEIPESERTAPLSSWIAGVNEELSEDEEEELETLRSERGGVATEEVKEVFGSKAFPYPKPLSLMRALLAQATKPGDTVLDFFAGSGTTAHALLQLNAEDNGNRHFILCSSTEATAKERDKNICRDICAERVRRVISGLNGRPAVSPSQGGSFAYLELVKIPSADAPYELTAEQFYAWIGLHRLQVAVPTPSGAVKPLGRLGDCDLLLLTELNAHAIETLVSWPSAQGCARLAIYSRRPDGLAEVLAIRGVQANVYGLVDTVLNGAG